MTHAQGIRRIKAFIRELSQEPDHRCVQLLEDMSRYANDAAIVAAAAYYPGYSSAPRHMVDECAKQLGPRLVKALTP
jgi:hypothetical protein